jgi:hypothetical protein
MPELAFCTAAYTATPAQVRGRKNWLAKRSEIRTESPCLGAQQMAEKQNIDSAGQSQRLRSHAPDLLLAGGGTVQLFEIVTGELDDFFVVVLG